MNLKIQCPKCSKRFTVHEDLTGKTVECGACDHRFPVKSESIIVEKTKFYPGEQKGDFLDRLGKQSPLNRSSSEGGAPLSQYAPMPQVDAIMPSSPAQMIAVGTGVTILVLYALVFFYGTNFGQIFQDVDLTQRFLLGGFVSLLGGGLIIYGAKNWRVRGVMITLFLVASLMGLVAMRKVHKTPVTTAAGEQAVSAEADEEDNADPLEESEIVKKVGYDPIRREITRQAEKKREPAEEYVMGIYISDIHESQYQFIERFFRKRLNLPVSEAILVLKRNGDRDRLIVISGVKMDFDAMVQLCEKLGQGGRVNSYPQPRIIDLVLSATLTQEPDKNLLDKLKDPAHPAFFSVNLNELGHLDSQRVNKAIARLANVPAGTEVKYNDRIISSLLGIVNTETEPEVLSDIGKIFKIYADGSNATLDKVNQLIPEWIDKEIPVQKSMIEFLVDNQDPRAAAVIDQLWSRNPAEWDEQYATLGSGIETRLIYHLEESPLELKRAAASLLHQVGTSKCLPALTALKSTDDQELRILVERAINSSKSR